MHQHSSFDDVQEAIKSIKDLTIFYSPKLWGKGIGEPLLDGRLSEVHVCLQDTYGFLLCICIIFSFVIVNCPGSLEVEQPIH